MKQVLFALALTILPFTSAQAARGVAQDMTCAQTKAYYNQNGRIYVRVLGNLLPIYGLVQSCPIGYSRSAYWTRTLDTKTCVIGFSCYHNGGHR